MPINRNALLSCIVLFAVVLGCRQFTPTTTAPVRKRSPDLTVTATEISQEFETNSAAANARYRGKTVAVSGSIDIWARWMGLAVMFQTPREGRTIRCSFVEKDRDSFRQVYQLKVSEKVTLIGYCKGAETSDVVEIVDCALR